MSTLITKPPEKLVFASLAELHVLFCQLLLGKDFSCPRQIAVNITAHHFLHLVKLQKGSQTEFTIEVEEPLIRAVVEGFGDYSIDQNRAERLSWIPEILSEPHEIWEYLEAEKKDS